MRKKSLPRLAVCRVWLQLVLALFALAPVRDLRAELPAEIRVVSYNIHHGEGTDAKFDLPRIATLLRSVEPHIVALQEVDQRTARSSGVDQPEELARLTGMQVVFGRNIDYQGGGYGTALLTRLPIKAHASHKLPSFYSDEQRGVQVVELGDPGEEGLIFLVTHLEYRADDRERMASAEMINSLIAKYGNQRALLAGDLNAVPDSRVMREFARMWTPATAATPANRDASDSASQLFTFPSSQPTKQIDYILYRPADRWEVVEVRVLEEPVASDHRPIMAVLKRVEASAKPQ